MQKQAPEQIYKLEFGHLNQDAYKIFRVKYLLDSQTEIWSFGEVLTGDTNSGVPNICVKIEAMAMNKITVRHLEE